MKNKFFFLIFLFFYLNLFDNKLLFLKKKINKLINAVDLSVIIPIYNNEKLLPICLKSVIGQSLKNIEIICIDDGSTDNSLEILKQFKKKDNRIIIIHQKNHGSAIARNKGILISKGKFLAFMDSDDCYPNNLILELMLNKAIQNKVLICGGGLMNFILKNNSIILKKSNIYFTENKIVYYFDYQYDYYYQRFIYKRNFIKKKKLYFPNYLRYQDPPFFIKAMALAKKFYALKNITYYHKISNKIRFINERKIIDLFKGIRDCLYISKSLNLYNLYYTVLCHFNSNYIINNTKNFINNKHLRVIISQIIKNIDYELLKKNNFIFIKNKFYNQLK